MLTLSRYFYIKILSVRKMKEKLFFYVFLFILPLQNGFYVPGVAPIEFKIGDFIDVRVSNLIINLGNK